MIIDFHTHIFLFKPAELAGTIDLATRIGEVRRVPRSKEHVASVLTDLADDPTGAKLVREMDRAGIDMSCCFPMDLYNVLDDDGIMDRNRAVYQICKTYPDRLIPWASVDPRRKRAPQILQQCIEQFGVRGLKWHPDRGYDLTSDEASACLEVAQAAGLILLSHCGPLRPPRHNRLTHPLYLDDVSLKFPNLKIVAAHCGGLWRYDWVAVATFNDNLYGDLAEWQLEMARDYGHFCKGLRELIDQVGVEKIIFATDFPGFDCFMPTADYVNAVRRLPIDAPAGIRFTPSEIDAILGGNARKLLGV